MLDESSSLGLASKEESELAIRALGALHWYLKECKLEQELLSRRSFEIYHPIDEEKEADTLFGTHMVLDGMTLRNLDVLVNSSTGTTHGTLLERFNRCNTAFGQRMLRHWLCAPLCQPEAIEDRLDAVEYLTNNLSTMEEVGKILKSLPDLERLVNKIHSQGSSLKAKNHPDSRAVFFDGHIYSKKKITDFLLTLEGFRAAQKVEEYFRDTTIVSKLLRQSVKLKEYGGEFPDMEKELEFFRKAFDHQQAVLINNTMKHWTGSPKSKLKLKSICKIRNVISMGKSVSSVPIRNDSNWKLLKGRLVGQIIVTNYKASAKDSNATILRNRVL